MHVRQRYVTRLCFYVSVIYEPSMINSPSVIETYSIQILYMEIGLEI